MDFRNYTNGQALPDNRIELNAVYASLADYLNGNVGQQLQYKDLMNRILVKAMGAAPAAPAYAPAPAPPAYAPPAYVPAPAAPPAPRPAPRPAPAAPPAYVAPAPAPRPAPAAPAPPAYVAPAAAHAAFPPAPPIDSLAAPLSSVVDAAAAPLDDADDHWRLPAPAQQVKFNIDDLDLGNMTLSASASSAAYRAV